MAQTLPNAEVNPSPKIIPVAEARAKEAVLQLPNPNLSKIYVSQQRLLADYKYSELLQAIRKEHNPRLKNNRNDVRRFFW